MDSSLYYLHLDLPSDRFLVQNIMQEDFEQEKVAPAPLKPSVARKPLNSSSRPGSGAENGHPIHRIQGSQGVGPPVSEMPMGMRAAAPIIQQVPSDSVSLLPKTYSPAQRRPLGPRPLVSGQEHNRMLQPGLKGAENQRHGQNGSPAASAVTSHLRIPARPDPKDFGFIPESATGNTTHNLVPSGDSSNPGDVADPQIYSITLIRRDPQSGAQWNVGRITCPPHPSSNISNSTQQDALVGLQIATPGYAGLHLPPLTNDIEDSRTSVTRPIPQFGFDRQVFANGPNKLGHSFKHRKQKSLNSAHIQTEIPVVTESEITPKELLSQNKTRRLCKNGYRFLSPWNGRCEFTTGNRGRSLKCNHMLSDTTLANAPGFANSTSTKMVSELRFNLPSADLINPSDLNQTSRESQRPQSTFSHTDNALSSEPSSGTPLPNLDPTSYAAMYPSDEEEDNSGDSSDDRLGLSLGREKAGGGVRGKRTKLGKLIVHDEGMKMLDLVVAANMGIWWHTWQG